MEIAIIGMAVLALITVGAAAVACNKAWQAKETLRQIKEEFDGFVARLKRK